MVTHGALALGAFGALTLIRVVAARWVKRNRSPPLAQRRNDADVTENDAEQVLAATTQDVTERDSR